MNTSLYAAESERAVLGSALLDNALLRGPLTRLSTDEFHGSLHQDIYRTMLELSEVGQSFDVLVLAEALKSIGHFTNGDGCIYLDGLTDGVIPDAGRVEWHVKRITEAAHLRRLAVVCENFQYRYMHSTATPAQLLEQFRQQFADFESDCPRPVLRRPGVLNLSQVEGKAVPWLWQPYLPKGMLAMLSGDPAAGKTYIALAIAAALTIGRLPYTGEPCLPVNVLYLSVENSPEYVVRPRFDLLGGEPERFHILRGWISGEGKDLSSIKLSDIPLLADAMEMTDAGLVIVDPIQSYLGAAVDAHRSNETRPVLDGLIRLAEDYTASILLVRHFAKSPSGKAIHRGLGSIDLTGAARTELHAGSVDGEHAMVQAKSNLGQYGDSLGYVIEGDGSFRWTGKSDLTAIDLQAAESTRDERCDLDEACDYLDQAVANGPRPVKELKKGTDLHFRTLQRAAKQLSLKKTRENFTGPWMWGRP